MPRLAGRHTRRVRLGQPSLRSLMRGESRSVPFSLIGPLCLLWRPRKHTETPDWQTKTGCLAACFTSYLLWLSCPEAVRKMHYPWTAVGQCVLSPRGLNTIVRRKVQCGRMSGYNVCHKQKLSRIIWRRHTPCVPREHLI